MQYTKYQSVFFLNASHSAVLNGRLSDKHKHTWELSLVFDVAAEENKDFSLVEKNIVNYLEQYQGCYLNEVPPFDVVNPVQENLCEFFRKDIEKITENLGWKLIRITIAETPIRSYMIEGWEQKLPVEEPVEEPVEPDIEPLPVVEVPPEEEVLPEVRVLPEIKILPKIEVRKEVASTVERSYTIRGYYRRCPFLEFLRRLFAFLKKCFGRKRKSPKKNSRRRTCRKTYHRRNNSRRNYNRR